MRNETCFFWSAWPRTTVLIFLSTKLWELFSFQLVNIYLPFFTNVLLSLTGCGLNLMGLDFKTRKSGIWCRGYYALFSFYRMEKFLSTSKLKTTKYRKTMVILLFCAENRLYIQILFWLNSSFSRFLFSIHCPFSYNFF